MKQTLARVSLVVRDYEEAVDWFTRVLGFEVVADRALGAGKRWVVVAPRGGRGAEVLLARAAKPEQADRIGDQTGGRVFLFLETDDFARDHAALTAKGVVFVEGPRHEDYGTVAVFKDLYGNKWDLVEPKRAAPSVLEHRYVLAVPSAEERARFFEDALGFERVPVGDPGWRFVRKDGCFLMLGSCPDALAPSALGDHAYFAYLVVPDVDALHERLVARGAQVLGPPAVRPWGMRELALRTPDGHRIMLGSNVRTPDSSRA